VKGTVDAAFLRRERGVPGLAFRLLVKEPLVVILPRDPRRLASGRGRSAGDRRRLLRDRSPRRSHRLPCERLWPGPIRICRQSSRAGAYDHQIKSMARSKVSGRRHPSRDRRNRQITSPFPDFDEHCFPFDFRPWVKKPGCALESPVHAGIKHQQPRNEPGQRLSVAIHHGSRDAARPRPQCMDTTMSLSPRREPLTLA
jgi:hypothetical protein